jgi:hypothetical protein
VAAVRLLFIASNRGGGWTAPGLEPTDRNCRTIDLDGWCAWRLVGGNNREIGRSPRTFPSFHDCYQAVRDLQHQLPRAVLVLRHDDRENRWAWRAHVDDVSVATSGRLYQRHRECQSNAKQFFELLPEATTAYDVVTTPAARLPYGGLVPEQFTADDASVWSARLG